MRSSSGALLKSFTVYTCSYVYVTIYNSDFPQPTATPTPAPGSIGDRVWNDANRNGLQDSGEAGISGVRVELWVDSNNDGSHDTLVTSTTTNSSGNYSFTGLNTSKRYVVKFILPTCFVFTTANVGSNDAIDSDVTFLSYGGTDLISLATTRNRTDVDAAMYNNCQPTATPTRTPTPAPQLGSIGDRVWNDFNRNGIQEAGEPGYAGALVRLTDCNNNVLQSVNTDGNGLYRFSNLSASCYRVNVVLPGGFQFSPQDQGGNGNLDSDVTPGNGTTGNINLGAGQNLTNVDAGLVPQGGGGNTCIGDRTWRDNNANGIQYPGEPGLDGIEIYLGTDANNDGRIDRYFGNTISANGGQYQGVTVTLLTGWTQGCCKLSVGPDFVEQPLRLTSFWLLSNPILIQKAWCLRKAWAFYMSIIGWIL